MGIHNRQGKAYRWLIMPSATYVASFFREDRFIMASFLDLPLVTQGSSFEKAVENAEHALRIYLKHLYIDHNPIPEPVTEISSIKEPGLYTQITAAY